MKSSTSNRWPVLVCALVCAPMVFLFLNCLQAAYCDVQMIHTITLRTEMDRLRAEAIRRAGQLEMLLASSPLPISWSNWREEPKNKSYWQEIGTPSSVQLYAAIVDRSGKVVMHTDPARVGIDLPRGWYDRKVPEAGSDVVRSEYGPLAESAAAFDIGVPLMVDGTPVAELHEGLDAAEFDARVWNLQRVALAKWGVVLAAALVIDLAALWALIRLLRWNRSLGELLSASAQEQARVLAQIGGGLAHQIRNPLHALRLNLHILRRSQSGTSRLTPEQLDAAIRESDAEIDVLEGLMRDLLQFAVPDAGQQSEVELNGAVLAAIHLLEEAFRQHKIDVKTEVSEEQLFVAIDPGHLRQVVSNLLAFALINSPPGGQAEVVVSRRGNLVELVVGHSGPSLTKQQVAQIFQPFQSPRESGSGLELALVHCVTVEAGGTITCEKRVPSGNRFRISLPLVKPGKKGQ